MQEAVRKVTGGAPVRPGRVKLDVPPLIDNGNSVALSVDGGKPDDRGRPRQGDPRVHREEPAAQHDQRYLGPRAGRARIATRARIADTQTVLAIAQMSDGSFWSDSVGVVVTLVGLPGGRADLMARVVVNVPAQREARRDHRDQDARRRTTWRLAFAARQTGELIPRDIIRASSAPTTASRCSAPSCIPRSPPIR